MEVETKDLTVSQILNQIDRVLKGEFQSLTFVGEISSAKIYPSGHLYLSIKDEQGELSAVMWKPLPQRLGFVPVAGQAVRCYGSARVYLQRGQLQIVLQKMELAGEGLLQKKFLELKAKLTQEGLFETSRKRAIPIFPKAIGLVTSSAGAVIRDIDVKIRERFPSMKVYLVDSRVQGDGAASEIAAGVRELSASGLVDVIIVARGGGSPEDLWPFNEEVVCRAIFASAVPVVSGVGHETDVTLSDFVADARAPTPTAAAEMVTPSRKVLLEQIAQLERRLHDIRWFEQSSQRVDEISERFFRSTQNSIDKNKHQLSKLSEMVLRIEPSTVLKTFALKISNFESSLNRSLENKCIRDKGNLLRLSERFTRLSPLEKLQKKFSELDVRLQGMNPRKVMERGYSIVTTPDGGSVVPEALKQGDAISIQFSKGEIGASVATPLRYVTQKN